MPPAGVEPATRRLKVGCSNQLSYRGFLARAFSTRPRTKRKRWNSPGGCMRGDTAPRVSPLPPALPIDATGEPYQTRPPGAPANKSVGGAATCYRGRQRTVGQVGLEPTTFLMCPVYSRVPSPNSAALTHETRERPVLGDECRTSLPRVSSGSRTRTYNPTINSRLRCLLRHAGIMKTLCSSRSVRPAGIEPAPPA